MHTRSVFLTGLSALLLCLLLPTVAAAASSTVITIKKGTSVVAGVSYPSLEELRKATVATPPLVLAGDTQIVLHNDDNTLEEPLIIPAGSLVTLKSAGGKTCHVSYKGTLSQPVVQSIGDTPALALQNVRVSSSVASSPIAVHNTNMYGVGTLDIANSYFDTTTAVTTADVYVGGAMNTTLTNSVIAGSGNYGVGIVAEDAYANAVHANLNLVFDKNAPEVTTWNKGVRMTGAGSADLGVRVAKNRIFDMQGLVAADTTGSSAVTKTGGGVWRVRGGTADHLYVNEGVFDLSSGNSVWIGDTVTIGSKGILKLTYDPGNVAEYFAKGGESSGIVRSDNMSFIDLDGGNFFSEEGARTLIGNISLHSNVPITTSGGTTTRAYGQAAIYVGKDNTQNSTIASSMNIKNKLLTATWHSANSGVPDIDASAAAALVDKDIFALFIHELNSLSTLEGVGSWADTYRKMNLSAAERDMLDYIYCTGGAGDGLGFLQTMSGAHVQNSLLAMRNNQANFTHKINQRLTRYQKEELEINVSDELCDYSDYDPINEYGEMWAYADQTWTKQDDVDNIAGYRYQAHTLGVGYDWHRDNWIWGGAVSYAGGDTKLLSNTSSRTDFDTVMLALYASWAQEGYYLSGQAFGGYGWNESTSKYSLIGFDPVTADTGNYATSALGANIEVGYMMETDFQRMPLRITPYGSLTYARIHRNAVRESGGANGTVNMNRQFRSANWPVWDAALGVRLTAPIDRCGYLLIPSLDLAWTRTLGSTETGGGDAWFLRDPSSHWRIPLMEGNRSSLRVAAGLEAKIKDNLSIGGGYNFEWRENSWSHQLNMNVSLGF